MIRARDLIDRAVGAFPAPALLPRTRVAYETLAARERAVREARSARTVPDLAYLDAEDYISPDEFVRLGGSGLVLSLEDQWAIMGAKGTGKTTFELGLLDVLRTAWPMAGANVLDSKPDKKLRSLGERLEQEAPPAPARPGEVVIWAPPDNDIFAYDDWFKSLLQQYGDEEDDTPSITVIDELSSVGGKSGQSFPTWFYRLMKQGRSNKKCLIILSQDVAYIPRQVIGQATHLARFRLITEPDALRCDMILHGSAKERREPASRYGLWHRRLDAPGAATHYTDWRGLLS